MNGGTYIRCLKVESSTKIQFTITETMTLRLVFAEGSSPDIKINDIKTSSTSGNIITQELTPGTYTLTKASTHNLFHIDLIGNSVGIERLLFKEKDGHDIYSDDTYYDMTGRPISKPSKGIYIRNGKKVWVK